MEKATELQSLWDLGFNTIRELESESGILASSKTEIFGCLFGRDSLITSELLLQAYKKTKDEYLLSLVRKILVNLATLQGKEVNIESGEEPGKIIHEYRPTDHERLTKAAVKPWYVYPDGTMKSYDTVDATPLFLMACRHYYEISGDDGFLKTVMPAVKLALNWLTNFGDKNGDLFVDYDLNPARVHGGLAVQSWMDSGESIFHEDGSPCAYPIAPVEVQAYAYCALKVWGEYLRDENFIVRASALKAAFNRKFILESSGKILFAQNLDGNGVPFTTLRSCIGHCLWAATVAKGGPDCIIDQKYIPEVVNQLMSSEIFEPDAGIRTLSTKSKKFDPNSYHNGSIWPHDTALVAEGFINFGYIAEARQIYKALFGSYQFFKTPIELFGFGEGKHFEYRDPSGHGACKKQAWSAAALLTTVKALTEEPEHVPVPAGS